MTRHFWVLLHRYAGLFMAFFLVVAGLTGSVLAFYQEIDHWLNPEQYQVPVQDRAMLDPFELRERALTLLPKAEINIVRFRREPGEVYSVTYKPEITDGQPDMQKYNVLRLNPYTGDLIELSEVSLDTGYWPLTRKNILTFIYDLHYKLALGEFGVWLFGIVAVVWTLDCFVGFYLTLPARRKASQQDKNNLTNRTFWARWAVAWKIKWYSSTYRLNFDLHRASGLWTWVMLFVFAWSSVDFNLNQQVYQPVMKTLFTMTDFATFPRAKLLEPKPKPALDWHTAHAIGQQLIAEQGQQQGFKILAEDQLFYDPEKAVFGFVLRSDQDIVNQGGITTIYFDGDSGALVESNSLFNKNSGDTITFWLWTLHMARIWGLPYKIFVCLMGLVVAMLSITGVYLWLKKRKASALSKAKRGKLGPNSHDIRRL